MFLESKNSVSNQGLSCITYSAWIYEELKIAHSIRESRSTPTMENAQVSHNISPFLESLETITLSELSQQIKSMGCGSGGGGESPVEISVSNNGDFQIRSKADSVTIQGIKLNRGNCAVRFFPILSEYEFQIQDVSDQEPLSMQDLKDIVRINEKIIRNNKTYYNLDFDSIREEKKSAHMNNRLSQLKQKGVMMEPQTLKFGEKIGGISQGCDIIEATIQTDKGSWTFNFNR